MKPIDFLQNNYACNPAMRWIRANESLTPRQLWETCPDGSWMAWKLWIVRDHLTSGARNTLRGWAIWCAERAITVHAPAALLQAAACHPDEHHRNELLRHAEGLAKVGLDAATAAATAAAAARAECQLQADELRKCFPWEWARDALRAAGVEIAE